MRILAAACGLLSVALVGALAGWRRTSRQLFDYRTANAPTVDLAPGACPREGLVAHWRLDARESGRFADASGLGHDLLEGGALAPLASLRGSGLRPIEGRLGGAVALDGRAWLVGANDRCFATGTLSVAAWVRLAAAVDVPTIVAKSTWPADGFWLLVTSSPPLDSSRRLQLGLASDSGIAHVDADYLLAVGEWHHVAFSLDGAAHEVRFYVDGALHGPVHRDVPTWQVNTTHPIVVGDYDDTGRWPWNGGLDDVRVWNRVVSAAEVRAAFDERR